MRTIFLLLAMLPVGGSAWADDQRIELNGESGSVLLLRSLTNFSVPSSAPAYRVCVSPNGEQADVLEQIVDAASSAAWLRIMVITGACAGQTGWIRAEQALIR